MAQVTHEVVILRGFVYSAHSHFNTRVSVSLQVCGLLRSALAYGTLKKHTPSVQMLIVLNSWMLCAELRCGMADGWSAHHYTRPECK